MTISLNSSQKGFTLIELLIVIAILGFLANVVVGSVQGARQKAFSVKAKQEFKSIESSLEQYKSDNGGNFPDDANRDIPPGLEQYLAPGIWPDAPWPGSVYDWDNWVDPDTDEPIYQISVRFCPAGQPTQCNFPKESWAEDFDINSSVYYCIEGPCRAHINQPINHPGYCINCPEE
jgi:prepilin-type N-terminal cleavage/methylation domain-containing protein